MKVQVSSVLKIIVIMGTNKIDRISNVDASNLSNHNTPNTGDTIVRKGHCCLCCKNLANKSGSHIIPRFLMKMVNAKVGTKERDHEIGFNITNDGIQTYFGRSIYEDDRIRITDNEEKLMDTTNLDVKDYIYCDDCEKFFAKYEDKYASSLSCINRDGKDVINKKIKGEEAMLFWASVVWRVSSASLFNKKLPQMFEDSLRQMLITEKLDKDISYMVFRSYGYCQQHHNAIASFDVSPNCARLIIGEFVLIMFYGQPVTKRDYCMEPLCIDAPKFNNGMEYEIIIKEDHNWLAKIINKDIKKAAKAYDIYGKIINAYSDMYNSLIPIPLLAFTLQLIFASKLGDRYTNENIRKCIIRAKDTLMNSLSSKSYYCL